MDSAHHPAPEELSFQEAAPGLWRWLALRRIAESPCHGYELIRYFERLGWSSAPAAGALYPYLGKFSAEGMLTVRQRGRRKVYEITRKGEEHLRATAHPYFERLFQAPQLENAQDADFSAAAAEVAGAIDILKERGTPKQLKQGARVLSKAAEALRRVADVSTSGAGATAAEA